MILSLSPFQCRAATTLHLRVWTTSQITWASLTPARPKTWITPKRGTLGWTRTRRRWFASGALWLRPFAPDACRQGHLYQVTPSSLPVEPEIPAPRPDRALIDFVAWPFPEFSGP